MTFAKISLCFLLIYLAKISQVFAAADCTNLYLRYCPYSGSSIRGGIRGPDGVGGDTGYIAVKTPYFAGDPFYTIPTNGNVRNGANRVLCSNFPKAFKWGRYTVKRTVNNERQYYFPTDSVPKYFKWRAGSFIVKHLRMKCETVTPVEAPKALTADFFHWDKGIGVQQIPVDAISIDNLGESGSGTTKVYVGLVNYAGGTHVVKVRPHSPWLELADRDKNIYYILAAREILYFSPKPHYLDRFSWVKIDPTKNIEGNNIYKCKCSAYHLVVTSHLEACSSCETEQLFFTSPVLY